jgi:LuxR family maltose regulon positive regulatory protein
MPVDLLATKFYIPSVRPELVARPRLINKLNTGLRRKLTLISAPAGFGKTTLVAEWLRDLKAGPPGKEFPSFKPAWLSLDEDDNDPVRFVIYLIAALESVQPEVGLDAQALLQSPQPPPLKSALTMLINDLVQGQQQQPPKPEGAGAESLLLVLDDYHLIKQPAIHRALTFLLDHRPPQLHLVITSRVDPPLPLARLRARNQLTEIRAADLRFTAEEIALFLNQAMGLALPPNKVALLEARTEGWIAGLQLAGLSMRSRASEQRPGPLSAFSGSHHHIIDYLAEEVMAQQPVEIRDFLYRTAILDRLTPPLCNAVTGQQNGETILRQLEQANLFLIPLDDQRTWYRYHHLFADFLRSRLLRQSVSPASPGEKEDNVTDLHRRASQWYVQNELVAPAIAHAVAAGDFEQAADLVEQVVEATIMRSEITTLLGWMDALPDAVVRTRPRLGIYQTMALLLKGQPLEEIKARLEATVTADTAGSVTGEILTLRAFMATVQGELSRSTNLTQQALERLPADNLFFRSYIAAYMGLPHLLSGNLEAATRVFKETARIGRKTGNLIIQVIALCRLAHIALIQGQTHRARSFYEQALEIATIPSDMNDQIRYRPVAGMALMGLGDLFSEWHQLEKALTYLLPGIELSEKWSDVASMYGYITLAQVKQAQGAETEAHQAIQTARQRAAQFDAMDIDDILVGTYQVRLWLAQDNLIMALRWVEERGLNQPVTLDAAESQSSALLLRVFEYIPLAQVRLAQGRPDQARDLLERLRQVSESAGWTGLTIEILALQALAFQALDNPAQAMVSLQQALSLAEPEGFVRLFINKGTAMIALLQRAAERGVAASYVAKLLVAASETTAETVRRETRPSVRTPQPLIEPLSDREREVLELTAAGLSNQEIADTLVIAVSTVKTHLNNIYRKLNVTSRTQAVAQAQALKLL